MTTTRLFRLSSAALVVCLAVVAQRSHAPKIPGWALSGTEARGYFIALDRNIVHGGKASAMIRCDGHCSQFGTITQTIKSDNFVNQRMRLSAWIKGDKTGTVALRMRVDGPNSERLAFDRNGKSGNFNWHRLVIHYGIVLEGNGQAWFDDMTLEPVAGKRRGSKAFAQPSQPFEVGAATQRAYRAAPIAPVNLDFEQELP